MSETVMRPHQVRSAMLRAETFDPNDNSIEVVWTTGAAVTRYDWDGQYIETLDVTPKAVRLDRLNAGASFLDSHRSSQLANVLGSVVPGSAKIAGGEGLCRIQLSTDPAKAGVVGDIKAKVIRNISVGYITHAVTRTEGKDGTAATCRVTDWEPVEISAVPIPADPDSQVRAIPSGEVGQTYPCAVERVAPPAEAEASLPDATVIDAVAPEASIRAAETARVQGIIRVARQLGVPDALADSAIASATTLDAFRALAIDARGASPVVAPPPAAPAIPSPAPLAARAAATEEAAMTDIVPAVETRAVPVAAPAPAAPDAVAIRAQETARVQGILLTGRKLGLPQDVTDKAIADGAGLEAFRSAAIDAVAARQADGQISVSLPASDPAAHRVYAEAAEKLPKGTNASRAMLALAATRGDKRSAADFVQRNYGTSGDVVARALTTSVGTAGGFLVPDVMSTEVIELLRPESCVMALGPNIIPMANGNFSMSRVSGGATASYVGETANIIASQETFGKMQLSAKKLAALVPLSNDMIRFPSISIDTVVRNDMIAAIAQYADAAFIRGKGTQYSPRGFLSLAADPALGGANVIVSTAGSPSLVTVTTDLGKAELALANANVKMRMPGWIMSQRSKMFLYNLRDGLGNQVFKAEMDKGMLRGKPFKATTQVPNNLAGVDVNNAATTDGSEIYLADFAEVYIGEAFGLEIDVFPGGAYVDSNGNLVSGISTDETVMRAIVQHDINMRQQAAVAVITGVRWF